MIALETLFPGTDHVMVTAYHLKGGQVVLTHYCTSGNHPQMALDRHSTKEFMSFTLAYATNFNAEKDMHMHNSRLKLTDNDHLECEWDAYKDGKLVSVNKFFLTRKK